MIKFKYKFNSNHPFYIYLGIAIIILIGFLSATFIQIFIPNDNEGKVKFQSFLLDLNSPFYSDKHQELSNTFIDEISTLPSQNMADVCILILKSISVDFNFLKETQEKSESENPFFFSTSLPNNSYIEKLIITSINQTAPQNGPLYWLQVILQSKVSPDKTAATQLQEISLGKSPPPRLNEMLYTHSLLTGKPRVGFLETEYKFYPRKELLLEIYLHHKNFSDNGELTKLKEDPKFSTFFRHESIKEAIDTKQWLLLIGYLFIDLLIQDLNGIFFLTAIAGLIWFSIYYNASQPTNLFNSSLALYPIAIFAGILSIAPTLFFVYIQDSLLGWDKHESLIQGLAFYIAGVGLREEAMKLLLFLPFIPWLLKRNNAIEWLLVPGMIGLGFAIEENINYFVNSGSNAVLPRFLTANFIHVALTAIAGESLCYFFRNKKYLNHFLSTFFLVIILHGLYDSFIALPQLINLRFVSFIILIYICFLFFGRLKNNQMKIQSKFNLTAHFLWGVSLIAMMVLSYQTYDYNLWFAFKSIIRNIADLGIIIYLYLYCMPNSMIKMH